mgnify:FL=1
MMNQDCYPFTFVHRSRNCGQGILYVDIYRFKSTKSNLVYLVRVERYKHNMYAVKFYQKNHRLSPKKYQILSNTFEARRIIYTCMNIMFLLYKENPRASFGFIGANCENESQENTKRYRVYNKIVATQVSENIFKHVENMGKSAYMLINRDELKEYPDLVEEIERTFQELYDYFD